MSEQVIYYGSKGPESVEDMHLAKLGNVVRKIERGSTDDPRNTENLGRIKQVFERRQAAWEAANPSS